MAGKHVQLNPIISLIVKMRIKNPLKKYHNGHASFGNPLKPK
jgi:hypothetical protein